MPDEKSQPPRKGTRKAGEDRGLFQRDGAWWIQYFDAEGKRHREKVGPRKSEARARYMQRKDEVRRAKFDPEAVAAGRPARREVLLLDTLIALYGPKVKVRDADRARFSEFWQARLGQVPAEDVKPGQIEDSRTLLLTEGRTRFSPEKVSAYGRKVPERKSRRSRSAGLAPATCNRYVSFLRRVYSLAVRDDLVPSNPCLKVPELEEDNERKRHLLPGEEDRLLAAFHERFTPAEWRLVELAILTGMRRGEQFGLRREKVFVDLGYCEAPKSRKGRSRIVRLNARACTLLREILAEHDADWVFPNRAGTGPMDADNFYSRRFLPACEAAGIADFTWHDLRHTFASRLAMHGAREVALADLLGHDTLDMVRRYSHLMGDHLSELVEGVRTRGGATSTATEKGGRQRKPRKNGSRNG